MDNNFKTKGFRRRVIALAALVGLLLVLFIARLAQFQLIEGQEHADTAASAWGEMAPSAVQSGSAETTAYGGVLPWYSWL